MTRDDIVVEFIVNLMHGVLLVIHLPSCSSIIYQSHPLHSTSFDSSSSPPIYHRTIENLRTMKEPLPKRRRLGENGDNGSLDNQSFAAVLEQLEAEDEGNGGTSPFL